MWSQGRAGESKHMVGECGGRGAGRAKPASSRNPVCLWSTNSQTTSGCNMTHAQWKGRRQFYLTYPGCLNIALSISLPRKMHTSGDLLSSASAKGRGDGPGWDPNSQSDPGQGSLCSLSLDSLKQRGDWPTLWSPVDSIEKDEFEKSADGRPFKPPCSRAELSKLCTQPPWKPQQFSLCQDYKETSG